MLWKLLRTAGCSFGLFIQFQFTVTDIYVLQVFVRGSPRICAAREPGPQKLQNPAWYAERNSKKDTEI